MEDLYSRIERLGKEHGFKNMTAICKAAGVPRTTMSELNKGRSKDLSKPNAQKFANALNLSLGEIYGEETKKAPIPEDERKDTVEEMKAAFWGGDKTFSKEDWDEMWNDVEDFARFRAEQQRKRKNEETN